MSTAVLIVYIILTLLKILTTMKILQQEEVSYTLAFNKSFIGFFTIQLQTIRIGKQNKKVRF